MTVSTQVAPPNSVILIEDSKGGDVPKFLSHALISATPSCVAVGCLSEDDGETEISLGPLVSVDSGERPVFDGVVQTPNRKLAIRTVHGVALLEVSVSNIETRLKIWANHSSEPDRIAIGIA